MWRGDIRFFNRALMHQMSVLKVTFDIMNEFSELKLAIISTNSRIEILVLSGSFI